MPVRYSLDPAEGTTCARFKELIFYYLSRPDGMKREEVEFVERHRLERSACDSQIPLLEDLLILVETNLASIMALPEDAEERIT